MVTYNPTLAHFLCHSRSNLCFGKSGCYTLMMQKGRNKISAQVVEVSACFLTVMLMLHTSILLLAALPLPEAVLVSFRDALSI
jgi:hypothetical protein